VTGRIYLQKNEFGFEIREPRVPSWVTRLEGKGGVLDGKGGRGEWRRGEGGVAALWEKGVGRRIWGNRVDCMVELIREWLWTRSRG
jgi:hypothetical protein